LEAKALYIDAEGTFRPERIIQIAKYRQQNPEQTLENIIYARAFTIEELLKIVMSLRNIEGIGLIILDSVSFHFSFYKDLNQYNRNIAMICLILNELLDLSIKKDICVVVTDFFINDKILCDPRCLHYIGKRIIIEKLVGNTRLIKSLFPPYEGVVKVNIDKNGITEK
ncbi:MAG: hypothetical protein J7K23_06820, partial [Thermoproteales archaeon]|nr:hypothetical protein [Thermoproteales archaeon]